MIYLATSRIFSYSVAPIRFTTYFGIFLSFFSFILGAYYMVRRFIFEAIVPGWTSIVVIILFLFGANFLILGMLGEYIGRAYVETKKLPRYVIGRKYY
jgi:hypothetical protein